MLRHNAHTQAIADEFNKKCRGFEYTIYRGHYDGWLVYEPVHADTEPRCEGYPTVILVGEDKVVEATFDSPWDPFTVLDYCAKHYDSLRPGRKILREYRRKVEQNEFASKKERDYITEIISMTAFPGEVYRGYDMPLNYADLCVYLSIAQRVGKRIAIKPEPEFTAYGSSQCDGWRYYIEITNKKL